jgi:hypothetical protein
LGKGTAGGQGAAKLILIAFSKCSGRWARYSCDSEEFQGRMGLVKKNI